MTKELYEQIRRKHGGVASWAIWETQGDRPKSNMGPEKVFNLNTNPSLLESLKTNVVMAGLNFSREVEIMQDFANFHDESPSANDFKIRYAFSNTPYYGAYMTDVLKDLVILEAKGVRDYLKENPSVLRSHINRFEEELDDLGSERPLLLAFGRDAFGILQKHVNKERFSHLIQITHYSHRVGKEEYREYVLDQIAQTIGSLGISARTP
jgi:hypothetical protein